MIQQLRVMKLLKKKQITTNFNEEMASAKQKCSIF